MECVCYLFICVGQADCQPNHRLFPSNHLLYEAYHRLLLSELPLPEMFPNESLNRICEALSNSIPCPLFTRLHLPKLKVFTPTLKTPISDLPHRSPSSNEVYTNSFSTRILVLREREKDGLVGIMLASSLLLILGVWVKRHRCSVFEIKPGHSLMSATRRRKRIRERPWI